jgi:type II secretory pathway predicted ATPase ExeA
MYRDFFQLDDYPFRLTADARYFFMGESHARAAAYLNYLLHVRDGIGMITGESGVGKTAVLAHVLNEIQDEVVVARIQQSRLSVVDLLLAVSLQFDLHTRDQGKATLLDAIQRYVRQQHFAGKQVLLVVDEAQWLTPDVLDEIRMLANLEKHGRKLMNVILCGQPALNDVVTPRHKDALSQSVRLNCHIEPLAEEELGRYIEYRLWIAGGEHTVEFPAETLPLLMQYSGGVPRLVNVLCDMTLIAAFMRNSRYVDTECVQAAITKLGWPPYAERVNVPFRQARLPSPGPVLRENAPRLRVYLEGRAIGEYVLDKSRLLIGRQARQDIVLDARNASRQHAQIINIDGEYYLQDLNSTNGTYVEQQAISWHALRPGDRFRIADYVLEYEPPEPAAPEPTDTLRRSMAAESPL